MSAAPLPPVLAEKLTDLAAEVRRAIALRGLAWFVIVVFGGAAAAVALDALLDLPGWVRGCLLAGWLLAGSAVGWGRVVAPLHRSLSPDELAKLVESRYPGLSERLTTLVELSCRVEPANGSRALIGALGRETESRAKRLDFTSATPYRESLRVGVGAAVAAVLLLCLLALVGGSTERVRRFVLPWYSPPVRLPYRLVVSSGSPVVRRGEPVTLTAYLERTEPGTPLPNTGVLVIRPSGASVEKPTPLTADAGATFSVTRAGVMDDFTYRVQVGKAVSAWHAVAVVDPVALADGTSVTVTPPAYTGLPAQTRDGFTEFEAIQFGTATLALKFNHAPVEASLQWVPTVATMSDPPRAVPLTFTADRLAASAVFPLTVDGVLRLVLAGERDVRTVVPAAVRVVPDTPPRFEKVIGLAAAAREARPDDSLPIDLTVSDDVRLAGLEFDYFLKDGIHHRELVSLAGVGTRRADGRVLFSLAGKVPEGEVVHFRIRAIDNRSVPDQRLEPQVAVYPPSGWATITVTSSARPLVEQEILAQRDRFVDKLTEATKLVTAAAEGASRVRARPAPTVLPLDQAVRLREARDKSVAAARLLDVLADEAAAIPDLRGLAGEARAIANGPVRGAETALRSAESGPTLSSRDRPLTTASTLLREAADRLTALTDRADLVARDRLDQKKLAQLAEEQKALATEAARSDSSTAELARKQRDLASRLAAEVAESEQLQAAASAAAAKDARELAARLRQLAENATVLARAAEQSEQDTRLARTRELARLQRDLSERAAQLGRKTETAARLAGTAPLAGKPFDTARDQLSRGNPADAAAEQEKAARELDRLAEALARVARSRGDTKEAARQVARWQDDLRRRVEEAVQSTPAGPLPPDIRQRFADEEQAIRDMVGLLRLGEPTADQVAAAKATAASATAIQQDPSTAVESLSHAARVLTQLAESLPTQSERLRQARLRLDQLRKEQAEIGRHADDAARGPLAKDRIGTAEEQDRLAQKVLDIDTPGHEARRAATAAAAGRAADDIRAGRPHDVPASQEDVRRRLDRLREALDGQTPTDEKAAVAARLQRAVADAVARLGGSPTADELKPVLELQREANRRLTEVIAPEAASQVDAARQSADATEQALRKNSSLDELHQRSQDAARAVEVLRDQLAGEESDRLRVERLTRERTRQADAARQAAPNLPGAESAARAKRDAQRQLAELRQTRSGSAGSAKQAAEAALERLLESTTPDRQVELQQAAADALDRLARELARNGEPSPSTPRPMPTTPATADTLRRATGGGRLPTEADAETARELARLQRELRDTASRTATDLARGAMPADADARDQQARQQQRQAELATEAGKIADAARAAEASATDPQAAGRLGQAADAAARARAAMARAGRDTVAGPREAAEMLRKAADATAGTPAVEPRPADVHARDAGEATREAAGLMRQAESQLDRPDGRLAATGAMRRAADSLDRAARSLSPTVGDGGRTPTANDNKRAAPRTDQDLPPEVAPYLGKPWGELPGVVKDRILQEVAAKYGDDYARTIRLYFEQVANRR